MPDVIPKYKKGLQFPGVAGALLKLLRSHGLILEPNPDGPAGTMILKRGTFGQGQPEEVLGVIEARLITFERAGDILFYYLLTVDDFDVCIEVYKDALQRDCTEHELFTTLREYRLRIEPYNKDPWISYLVMRGDYGDTHNPNEVMALIINDQIFFPKEGRQLFILLSSDYNKFTITAISWGLELISQEDNLRTIVIKFGK